MTERGTGRALPGVAVSDGQSVTVTDSAGAWELPVPLDAEFVFVTVPGTHVALGDFFLDVRDVPRRPDHHSFTLEARSQGRSERFRFVQVTDLHVSLDGGAALRALHEGGVRTPDGSPVTGHATEDELHDDLLEVALREAPAFVAATGDLANHGKPDELAAYKRATDALAARGVPTAHVAGNHDYLSELDGPLVERFSRWWAQEGRHAPGADPVAAFRAMAWGGDWRSPGSGRLPWLERLGPLWYSFDWGHAHFVVYDSEGLLRYGDAYPQDRWLAADLAVLAPGTPVIVLLHFSEQAPFFERFAGVDLVASFAGHWHGNRVVQFGGATHHVTSNLGFGGIDHSPRGYRVIDVDGRTVRSTFRPTGAPGAQLRHRSRTSAIRWQADLEGTAGLGPPARAGDVVLVPTRTDDGSGSVVALDARTGRRRWARGLESAAHHSARTGADGRVFVLTMTGAVIALHAEDGAVEWSCQLGEPSARWCLGAPTVAGGRVFAGASGCFGAIDAASGELVWQRDDAGHDDWPSYWCSPVVAGDVVVFAFGTELAHMVALDVATGDEHWLRRGHELAASWSSPVAAGANVLVTTVDGWLRARDITTGERRWTAALDAPWPVATPLLGACRAFTVSAAGTLQATQLADGEIDWRLPLGPAAQARAPYRREPAGHVASPAWAPRPTGPTGATGAVVAVSGNGRVVVADPATGRVLTQLELGAPVASSPLVAGDTLYCATVEDRLLAVGLDLSKHSL